MQTSLVLEAPNLYFFVVWDPDLGCLVLETLNLRISSEFLDPYLGCLLLDPTNMCFLFNVLDPDLGCLVLEPIFRENVQKHRFLHGLGLLAQSGFRP